MRLTTLKRLRLELGKLQLDVARAADIGAPRLSLIENGHVEASADELTRLAAALGADVDALREPDATATASAS
jgi:transcriptional regulator with XRE-family HTH domain